VAASTMTVLKIKNLCGVRRWHDAMGELVDCGACSRPASGSPAQSE
jgi:hypothetical protein